MKNFYFPRERERERENCQHPLLTFFVILILLLLSACNNPTLLIPPFDITDTTSDEHNLTIIARIPGLDDFTYDVVKSSEVPQVPDMDGLISPDYWLSEDGSVIYPGTILTSDLTVISEYLLSDSTAVYNAEDSSMGNLQEMLDEDQIEVLYLAAGTFDSEQALPSGNTELKISKGMTIIGAGDSPVSFINNRAAAPVNSEANETLINFGIVIATNEKVTLKNMHISKPVTEGTLLINGAEDIEVLNLEIDRCYLDPPINNRGIQIYQTAASANISMKDSFISISASSDKTYRAGMNLVFDDRDNTSLTLSMSDSSIYVDNEGEYGIGINIENVDSLNISIDNSSIISTGHGYALRPYGCGNNDSSQQSTILIENSELQGWAGFYIQADSNNIATTINDSVVSGISNEKDKVNSFASIGIDSSSNCTVNVNGGRIEAHNLYKGLSLFSIYYFDDDFQPAGNILTISPSTELVYYTDLEGTNDSAISKLLLGEIQNVVAVYDSSMTEIPDGDVDLEINKGSIDAWDNLTIESPSGYILGEFHSIVRKQLHDQDIPGRPLGAEYYDIDNISYIAIPEGAILVRNALESSLRTFTDIDELVYYLNTQSGANISIYISGTWSCSEGKEINSSSNISIYGNTLNPAIITNISVSQDSIDNILIGENITIQNQ